MKDNLIPIKYFLLLFAMLLVALFVSWFLFLASIFLLIIVFLGGRIPKHNIYSSIPNSVYSPISGTIKAVKKTNKHVKIRIHQSFSGPFTLHSPLKGKVDLKKSSILNVVSFEHGVSMGFSTSFIDSIWLKSGDKVYSKTCIGYICRTGSFELKMPPGANISVQAGDKVRAGQSLLANLQDEL